MCVANAILPSNSPKWKASSTIAAEVAMLQSQLTISAPVIIESRSKFAHWILVWNSDSFVCPESIQCWQMNAALIYVNGFQSRHQIVVTDPLLVMNLMLFRLSICGTQASCHV